MCPKTNDHLSDTTRFLKLSCTGKLKHDRCRLCPLTDEDCKEFCEYVQEQRKKIQVDGEAEIKIISPKEGDPKKTTFQDYKEKNADTFDRITPLTEAFISIEQKYDAGSRRHNFKAWVHGAVLNKENDSLRSYTIRSISLKEIVSNIKGCDVIVNNDNLMNKKIRGAYAPTLNEIKYEKVSGKSPYIKVVDIRENRILYSLSSIENIMIMMAGLSYKKDAVALFDELNLDDLINHVKENIIKKTGVLCWVKQSVTDEEIVRIINGMVREYIDEYIVEDDGDHCNEEEQDYEFIFKTHQYIKSLLSNFELELDFEKCFEEMFSIDSIKKCASVIYYVLTIEQELFKNFNSNDFYHNNGEVKQERIYEQLSILLGTTKAAAKQSYSRCLKEGRVYKYLRGCFGGQH